MYEIVDLCTGYVTYSATSYWNCSYVIKYFQGNNINHRVENTNHPIGLSGRSILQFDRNGEFIGAGVNWIEVVG